MPIARTITAVAALFAVIAASSMDGASAATIIGNTGKNRLVGGESDDTIIGDSGALKTVTPATEIKPYVPTYTELGCAGTGRPDFFGSITGISADGTTIDFFGTMTDPTGLCRTNPVRVALRTKVPPATGSTWTETSALTFKYRPDGAYFAAIYQSQEIDDTGFLVDVTRLFVCTTGGICESPPGNWCDVDFQPNGRDVVVLPAIPTGSCDEPENRIHIYDYKSDLLKTITLPDENIWDPAVAPDGKRFAYVTSTGTNDEGYSKDNVFVYDVAAGTRTLVSKNAAGEEGNAASNNPRFSHDSRRVVFGSRSWNLVENDRNETRDVFIHDLATGVTRRTSVRTDGSELPGLMVDKEFDDGEFDPTGRYVYMYPEYSPRVHVKDLVSGQMFILNPVVEDVYDTHFSKDGTVTTFSGTTDPDAVEASHFFARTSVPNGDDDRLFGNGGSDRLVGSFGDDSLAGGQGRNVMEGGPGNDVFDASVGADEMDGGPGVDTVTYASQTAVVVVTLDGANWAQVTLNGRKEDRVRNVESVVGAGAGDRLTGDDKANRLVGNGGGDVLAGRGGADEVFGGRGADRMAGGPGRDRFVYTSVQESPPGKAARDSITDFDAAGRELVDLSRVDGDATRKGRQSFTFVGSSAFDGRPGRLRFARGLLQGDTDGDRVAEFEIAIKVVRGAFGRRNVLLK
jgi:Ca2+-binding RTX toxin-like protein